MRSIDTWTWKQVAIFSSLIGGVVFSVTRDRPEKEVIGVGVILLAAILWLLIDIRDNVRGAAEKLGYVHARSQIINQLLNKQERHWLGNRLTQTEQERLDELLIADDRYSVARVGQLNRIIDVLEKLSGSAGSVGIKN